MKKIIFNPSFLLLAFLSFISIRVKSQSNIVREINRIEKPSVALEPLRFLASDELKGRATARPEIQIAARYISEQFRSLQLKQCQGTENYFQGFDIKMIS